MQLKHRNPLFSDTIFWSIYVGTEYIFFDTVGTEFWIL